MSLQPNRVITISSIDQLTRWWPFFREGLEVFKRELRWDKTKETYFRDLLHIHSLGPKKSIIIVLVSGGGQPYGYLTAADNTSRFGRPSVCVYSLYSNNKCPSTVLELKTEAEQWARANGYEVVQALSYRDNGAARRWFEKKMGFEKCHLVFSKSLCPT